jgi:hypothetical protein
MTEPTTEPVLYESLIAADLADLLDALGKGAVITEVTVRTARGRTITMNDPEQPPALVDTAIGTVSKIPEGRWSEIQFVRYATEGGACWFGEDPAARREGRDGEATRWAKTADLVQLGAVVISLPRPVEP